jgi:hypothetical protein
MTDNKRQTCPKCGFKIRGGGHDQGHHHQTGQDGKAMVDKR